ELPEALDVGLTEDATRPALRWIRDTAPVDRLQVEGDLRSSFHQLFRTSPRDPFAVDADGDVRIRVAGHCKLSVTPLVEMLKARGGPRRRPLEGLVGRVLEHRATNVLVAVERLHVTCARAVRLVCDHAHERRLLDVAEDLQVLSLPQVEADSNSELCVTADALPRGHPPI